MKDRGKILIAVMISVIVVLCGILAYGVYTGFRVRAEINRLNTEKEDLTSQLNVLQGKYDLLVGDVAKIYKGCIKENACKGRYPGVSWYCNNVGDETGNPSHVCICDASCDLSATQM